MYAESTMKRRETLGMTEILHNAEKVTVENISLRPELALAVDHSVPSPAEALEIAETPTAFEAMLGAAVTADERRMVKMLDKLMDTAWRFDTGKSLRGELRRMWNARGMSTPRFYTAFHALKQRRAI